MGFFKNLTKSLIDTALLPVDITLDACGAPLYRKDSKFCTLERINKVKDSLDKVKDDWDEYWDD